MTITATPQEEILRDIAAELARMFPMFEPWTTPRSLLTDGPTWTYRHAGDESRTLTVGYDANDSGRWRVWDNRGSSWSGITTDRLADAVAHHLPALVDRHDVSGRDWRWWLTQIIARHT